jgi:hypothetical protein
MINYHDRRFVPVSNGANGEVSPEVVFHSQQTGRIVTCRYSGGRIVSGQLFGLVDTEGRLDMHDHQSGVVGGAVSGGCCYRTGCLSRLRSGSTHIGGICGSQLFPVHTAHRLVR